MRRLSAALLLPLLLAPAARAQEGDVGHPFWISTPSAAKAALHEATVAAAAGRHEAAARALQRVFERFPKAFVLPAPRRPYVGAHHRARLLLATLPAGVRAAYAALYDRPAREALQNALAASDGDGLHEVLRRFEATPSGLTARLALADRALLRGKPAEARLVLRETAMFHPEAAAGPAVARRRALAAARDHADGGPAPRAGEDGAAAPFAPAAPAAWPMMNGDPPRTRTAAPLLARAPRVPAPELFGKPAYELPVDIPERHYDSPMQFRASWGMGQRQRSTYRGNWEDYWREFNPVQPAIARGFLVHHNGRQLFAHNLYTGEEKWRHPFLVDPTDLGEDGRTNLSQIFNPVVHDGVVYAALEVEIPYAGQRLQQVPITYYLPGRRLVAVELESGRLLWTHDDEGLAGHPDADVFKKFTITGAPLVRGDRIYVPATYSEGTFHAYVLAVDRRTGRLLFSTRINSGQQELNLFGRQLQECVSMPIAEADGVLYVGTSLGVFAAVDALTGTPVWAAAYPIEKIPSTFLWFEAPRRWPHFDNGPPLVADDEQVIVAPPDGTYVLSLDRRTGRTRWRMFYRGHPNAEANPRLPHFDARGVVGADAERVYLTGKGGVMALWLRDGENRRAGDIAWQQKIPEEDAGPGRALLAEDGLFVPAYGRVYRFDARTGKLAGVHDREGGEGDDLPAHLLFGDGVFVAAARDRITVRWDQADVLRLTRDRIAGRPDEPGPWLAAAAVHRATGALKEAIRVYREGIKRAVKRGRRSAEQRGREGLHRALLAQAEQLLEEAPERAAAEFDAALKAAPTPALRLQARVRLEQLLEAGPLMEVGAWRLRNLAQIEKDHGNDRHPETDQPVRGWALRRMAGIHADRGDVAQALEELHRLVEANPAGPDGRRANEEIGALLAVAGRELYEPYEQSARRLFDDALRTGDLAALERGLLIYANSDAAARATLGLAKRKLEAGDSAGATAHLQRFLVERAGSPHIADALVLLVRALDARQSHGPAFAALLRLKRRHGDALVLRDDGARVDARRVVEEWLTKEPYASLAHRAQRRDLEPPLALRFEKRYETQGYVDVPDLVGYRPAELRDVLWIRIGAEAAALDARTGAERYRIDLGAEDARGPFVLAGNRLHVLTESRTIVFAADTGKTVARHEVPERGRGLGLVETQGQIFALYRPRRAQGVLGIAALHPEDGTEIWRTRVPVGASVESQVAASALIHGDRLLLFSDNPAEMLVVDTTSGVLESRVAVDSKRHVQLLDTRLLDDGRVLLALRTYERRRPGWVRSYSLHLLDPSQPEDRAIVWSFPDGESAPEAVLKSLHVLGDRVVAVDMARGAVVLDRRTGAILARQEPVALPGYEGAAPALTASQPRHDSLLLVLTRRAGDVPARLHAFEVRPELVHKFSLDVGEPEEQAEVIATDEVLGVFLRNRRGRRVRARAILLDPLQARLLDEIPIPGRDASWFTVRVQNGILLVTTGENSVYAFGPR